MFKRVLITLLVIISSIQLGKSLTINESSGWIESAYVKWDSVEGADSYNVYYSGEGITDQKIDDQLIRNYGTYMRADILGLKAGSYTIKVAPVTNDVEGAAAETGSITVEAHDRTGFCFSNSRIPGAYKADGTPKDGAIVLYITENTKDVISLDVTGANSNPCVGIQTILDGFKKGEDNRPLIVRLVGQITDPTYLLSGDIVIENKNNASGYITFEGVGEDAVADGWGIRIKNASNIEVRNIGLMNCNSSEGDNIGLQQNNDYIWVHNCDFFYGAPGGDADQSKGDGALDCKKSTYVTFSYNHFWDSGKSNLLGNGGEDVGLITYHHNWYDHSDSRHPRVRQHTVHVYNNYFDGNSKYGIGNTTAGSVFVENNYFRNCKYPMLISLQGSDVYGGASGTFSSDPGGIIKAYGNYIEGAKRFVDQTDAPGDFDAYVVENKADQVPASVTTVSGGHTYNNFDTDAAIMYAYTPDSPEDAKTNVMAYAGRLEGGDFSWTFNNTIDDTSYDVDTDLKAALINYVTNLVSIQNDSLGNGGTIPGEPGDTTGQGGVIDGDVIHNFTLSGTSSTFFSITGNLSTSKGTETYGELTLTQCLKIESTTSISFTLSEEASLTLVFNQDFNGEIKINGTNYSVSSGLLTVSLAAGTYEITKVDTTNLYYMSIAFPSTEPDPDPNPDPSDGTDMINSESTEFTLYPNPVKDVLNISTEAIINKVEVYSMTGVLVQSLNNNTNRIDISDISKGCYVVMVFTDQGILKKMVIKK